MLWYVGVGAAFSGGNDDGVLGVVAVVMEVTLRLMGEAECPVDVNGLPFVMMKIPRMRMLLMVF